MSKYAIADRRCRCPSGSGTRASVLTPPQLWAGLLGGLTVLTSFIRSSLFAIGPGSQNGPMKKSHSGVFPDDGCSAYGEKNGVSVNGKPYDSVLAIAQLKKISGAKPLIEVVFVNDHRAIRLSTEPNQSSADNASSVPL